MNSETSDEDEHLGTAPQPADEPSNNSGEDDIDDDEEAEDEDDAPLYANMTVKEILSTLGTRGKAIPMPSTVKRNAERKRRRNRRTEMDTENAQGDNDASAANDTSQENAGRNDQAPSGDDSDGDNEEEEEDSASPAPTPGNVMAPQLVIDENGNIVIDQSSLVISSATAAPVGAELNAGTTTIDLSYGRKVTSATYSKREKAKKWKTVDTVKFYLALRAYGTDFSTMSRIFPGRSRKQLRNKFKKEEKVNLREINDALSKPMNAAEVERAFGDELRKVEAKEKEEEEKERLRNEEEDGIMANVNQAIANQAIEIDDDDNDNDDSDNEGCTAAPSDGGNEGQTETDKRGETNLDGGESQDEDDIDNEGNTLPVNNNNEEDSDGVQVDEGDTNALDGERVVEESDVENEAVDDDNGAPDDDYVGNNSPTVDKSNLSTKAGVGEPEEEIGGDEESDEMEGSGRNSAKIRKSVKKGDRKKRKNFDELEGESGNSDEGDEAERADDLKGMESKLDVIMEDDEAEDEDDSLAGGEQSLKKRNAANGIDAVEGDNVGNTTNEEVGGGGRKRKRRKVTTSKKRTEKEDDSEDDGIEGGDTIERDENSDEEESGEEGGGSPDAKEVKEQRGRRSGAVRKSARKKTRRKMYE